ncbi:MAG: PAS domain-containing protein [Rhizobiaceae bacterium]|nr:PAS domain-containing protein [Rhizobiaceae bacterium]
MQLQFDTNPRAYNPLDPESMELSPTEVLDAISRFDAVGLWRANLTTGLVYWSDIVYEIYGMEPQKGAVNVSAAIEAFHPDDREVVSRCMEEAANHKTGYRFVLRLNQPDGNYAWVKSVGLYRKLDDGTEEIFGYIQKFSAVARSVTILTQD